MYIDTLCSHKCVYICLKMYVVKFFLIVSLVQSSVNILVKKNIEHSNDSRIEIIIKKKTQWTLIREYAFYFDYKAIGNHNNNCYIRLAAYTGGRYYY